MPAVRPPGPSRHNANDPAKIPVAPAADLGRDSPHLTPDESRYYGRHLVLPQVGLDGQRKLKAGSVVVIGAGGLGCAALQYLAAAGVGRIGIVDDDVVDPSNLHRQVLYGPDDAGKPKVDVAKRRLEAQNPHVEIVAHRTRLTSDNALEVLRGYDVVIDGSDNFPTRYLVNDACVMLGKPNVYASVFRFEGQASLFWPAKGPCYRCLSPKPPPPGLVPSCAEGGVLGVLPGLFGVVQATEAMKVLLGVPGTLAGRLLLYDALGLTFHALRIHRNPHCPVCGDEPEIRELIDYEQFCGLRGAPGGLTASAITADEFHDRLGRGEKPLVIDVREKHEWDIARLPFAELIPLGTLPARVKDLPLERDIVVLCHTGLRSAQAVAFLRGLGYKRAVNLTGGIDAYAARVDPTVPRY